MINTIVVVSRTENEIAVVSWYGRAVHELKATLRSVIRHWALYDEAKPVLLRCRGYLTIAYLYCLNSDNSPLLWRILGENNIHGFGVAVYDTSSDEGYLEYDERLLDAKQ